MNDILHTIVGTGQGTYFVLKDDGTSIFCFKLSSKSTTKITNRNAITRFNIPFLGEINDGIKSELTKHNIYFVNEIEVVNDFIKFNQLYINKNNYSFIDCSRYVRLFTGNNEFILINDKEDSSDIVKSLSNTNIERI